MERRIAAGEAELVEPARFGLKQDPVERFHGKIVVPAMPSGKAVVAGQVAAIRQLNNNMAHGNYAAIVSSKPLSTWG